jgi:carbon-monoxide dehydrogenase medium subunit
VVAVAAVLRLAGDGTIADGRIAVAGAGPTPSRVPEAEAALPGRRPDHATFATAGGLVARSLDPQSDSNGSADYRRQLSAVLTERALADACRRVNADA